MSSSQRQRPAKFDVDPAARLIWQKSSLSGAGECVEIAMQAEVVFVRDSEEPDGPWLRFTHAQWRCFVQAVHLGEFDWL